MKTEIAEIVGCLHITKRQLRTRTQEAHLARRAGQVGKRDQNTRVSTDARFINFLKEAFNLHVSIVGN